MSASGQKQTSQHVRTMPALPPKADIETQSRNVRFVPKADILRCSKEPCYSIASPAAQALGLGTPVYVKLSKCGTLLSICELIEPMSRPILVGAKP
jgi:hypothetical protein